MTVTISGTSGIVNDATDLNYTGTLTGSTGVVNIGSGQVYKDASGNVGIGVTPSAWGGSYKALQFAAGSFGGNAGAIGYEQNAYQNGTNWIYRSTAAASHYESYGGAHYWFNAPSGTAGNAITFTQAMTLDSSGNLLVGTTDSGSGATAAKQRIIGAAANNLYLGSTSAGGWRITSDALNDGGTFYHIKFSENGTQRGSITSNGSSTSYVTSSDYRLKNTIAPMTGALDKVALLKPCTYKWNVDGSDGQGFIAHELQEVVEGCVTGEKDAVDADGNPQYQGIDTSFLVATLTAAIQELKAIVDTQAARITALEAANV